MSLLKLHILWPVISLLRLCEAHFISTASGVVGLASGLQGMFGSDDSATTAQWLSEMGMTYDLANAANQIELYQFYKDTYQPLETKLAEEAMSGLDPSRYLAEASSDVVTASNKAREAQEREMGRYGLDPTSGKYQGISDMNFNAQAAAEADARNEARNYAEATDYARTLDAVSLGKGIPASSSAALSSATSGISGAAGTQMDYAQTQSENAAESIATGLDLIDQAGWFDSEDKK